VNALPDFKYCPCPDHEGPRWLSQEAFRKNAGRKDGLSSWCKACNARQHRDERTRLRDQVFDHYGRVCACPGCGATDKLTIDHVNGGGTAHRIEVFGRLAESVKMHRWLIEQGFPDGFQVLCTSCNASKWKGTACRIDHAGTGLKRCPRPNHEGPNPLPLDAFTKSRDRRDGLSSWCRACTNQKQSQIRQRNKIKWGVTHKPTAIHRPIQVEGG